MFYCSNLFKLRDFSQPEVHKNQRTVIVFIRSYEKYFYAVN